jgi:Cu/Ag efflux protein CusF
MKYGTTFILITCALLTVGGTALAAEMSGEVTAVNAAKGTLTLKNGDMTVDFVCMPASLINETKVTDKVTVQYREADGRKTVFRIKLKKKRVSVGC